MKYTDVLLLLLLLTGCAGPVSPFGGVEVWSGDGEVFIVHSTEVDPADINVYPRRQVLHKAADLKIKFDPSKSKTAPKLKVTYNQKDITNTFLKSAKLERASEQKMQYIFSKLNLKPDRRHKIDIYYSTDSGGNFSHISYLPPVCPVNTSRNIASTEPFNPKPEFISAIKSTAQKQQLNPSLLAGLIAQESGFNPNEVSSAKAVGLTQVTPIADEEIRKLRPDWQSDPRIEKLSVLEIENLIRKQEISRRHDWRLDPKQAIEGGALYINYLINYWNSNENKLLLSSVPNSDSAEVILASYNSGAARVKSKIKDDGEDWLNDGELKEAFKYVNNVVSYCYHFSEEDKE